MLPAKSIRVPDKNSGEVNFMRYFPIGNDVANRACKRIINVIVAIPIKRNEGCIILVYVNSYNYSKDKYTIQIKKRGNFMKNFVLCIISKKKTAIVFFVIFLSKLHAMDDPSLLKKNLLIASYQKAEKLWDNKFLVDSGVRQNEVIPQGLVITPDAEGVFISTPGKVSYVNRNIAISSEPHTIIKHSHSKFSPLIAAAIRAKKSQRDFILISVLNNRSRKSQQPKIEAKMAVCTVGKPEHMQPSHNIFTRIIEEHLDWGAIQDAKGIPNLRSFEPSNVQAISLDSKGKFLTIAFKDFVKVMDLDTKEVCSSHFMPRIDKKNSFIVDVSTPVGFYQNSVEQYIVIVNEKGVLNLKRYTPALDRPSFSHVRDLNTGDCIEKIYFPDKVTDLIYISSDEVKAIAMADLLEHSEGNVKKRIISHHAGSKVTFDQDLDYSTVHWNDNPESSKEDRFRISIYREYGTADQNIIALLPDSTIEVCNVINEKGQEVSEPTHVLSAVKRGNFLIAVTTDGYLHFWQLKERHHSPTDSDVRGERAERNRSFSTPIDQIVIARKHAHTISGNGDERRKSAGRKNVPKLNIFRSNEHLKGERFDKPDIKNNPSPAGSPRKKNETPQKVETPRKKKSISSSPEKSRIADDAKFQAALFGDIYGDHDRKKEDD